MKKIKILIVDDSKLARETLQILFRKDPSIEVIGEAEDPYEAVKILKNNTPDLITLDIEMPKMDGLTFLKKIMKQHPLPIIIISSLTLNSSKIALRAMDLGACDVISKPLSLGLNTTNIEKALLERVHIAAESNITYRNKTMSHSNFRKKSIHKRKDLNISTAKQFIALGASTGGTEAFANILTQLNTDLPPLVVIQHMPAVFTQNYANRLNKDSIYVVKEAENLEILKNNHIYIAPGGVHTEIQNSNRGYQFKMNNSDFVNHVRPSIDVFFKSCLKTSNPKGVGIILTGMGKDGAQGLLHLKEAGWKTIAQNENSCVVYGMPKAAAELNAAQEILNLNQIAKLLNQFEYVF